MAERFEPDLVEATLQNVEGIHAAVFGMAGHPDLASLTNDFDPEHPANVTRLDGRLGLEVNSTTVWETRVSGLPIDLWVRSNSLEPVTAIDDATRQITVKWWHTFNNHAPAHYYLLGLGAPVYEHPGQNTAQLLEMTGMPDISSFLAEAAESVRGLDPLFSFVKVCISNVPDPAKPWKCEAVIASNDQRTGFQPTSRVETKLDASRLYAVYGGIDGDYGLTQLNYSGRNGGGFNGERLYATSSAVGGLLNQFEVEIALN